MDEAAAKFHFEPVTPFELIFKNVNVSAKVREKVKDPMTGRSRKTKMKKVILTQNTGIFSPNTFTAIVGPSGCGKTTLLNLVSGRLLSKNLSLSGQVYVNGVQTNDINQYGEKIGYVMQQDILLPTFTPKESFQFIADMRLVNLNRQQKKERVERLLEALGLVKCANTYIGNDLIRGISGGQKKRTSIGVQLLINPSLLLLDEPTTGLDSTTALHVIQFLNRLAKNGRTIVSTIHQPSSEIFSEFDKLIIMVQGYIVYQGNAKESMEYFNRVGFPVPPHSNPTDFYMKTMNKEGIEMKYLERGIRIPDEQSKAEFEQLVQYFRMNYEKTPLNIQPTVLTPITPNPGQGYLPFCGQVFYLTIRSIKSEFRNPLDVILRHVQIIFQAILGIVLFYKKSDIPFNQLQNTKGTIFYILSCIGFAGMFSNLAAFGLQRPVFIRERMSNTYGTGAFFVARNLAGMPLDLFLPFLFIVIMYFAVPLNHKASVFFWAVLISELVYFFGASYGFFLSALFKDITVVMALVPVVIIPLMLVGGFFTNLNNIPKIFYPLQYLSFFKYGYQAYIQNQYRDPVVCPDGTTCDILQTEFKFKEAFWLSLFLMLVIGIFFRILALIALYLLSNPKRLKLNNKKGDPAEMYAMQQYGVAGPYGANQAYGPTNPYNQAYANNLAYSPQMMQQAAPPYPLAISYPSVPMLPSATNLIAPPQPTMYGQLPHRLF